MPDVHHHTWYPGSRWFAVVSSCYCVKKKHWIFSVHHSTEGKWDRGKQNWRWVCALLAGNLTPGATVFATLFLKSIWFSKNSNSLRHKSLVSVFSGSSCLESSVALLGWDGGGVLTAGRVFKSPTGSQPCFYWGQPHSTHGLYTLVLELICKIALLFPLEGNYLKALRHQGTNIFSKRGLFLLIKEDWMQEEARRAVSDSFRGFVCANEPQGFKGRAKIKRLA